MYNVGVKDLASAYVLCPRLAECGGLSIYGRNRGLRNNEGIVSGVMTQSWKRIRTEYLGLIEVRLQEAQFDYKLAHTCNYIACRIYIQNRTIRKRIII